MYLFKNYEKKILAALGHHTSQVWKASTLPAI